MYKSGSVAISSSPKNPVVVSVANKTDMEAIYRLRHDIYSRELGQYEITPDGILPDDPLLDCDYIVAKIHGEITGMIGVTLPRTTRYSVDKFVDRRDIPVPFDRSLYEIRALSVKKHSRGLKMASILMYAAFRWIQANGGKYIISIGRKDVLDMYLRMGMERLNRSFECGRVEYELIGCGIDKIQTALLRYKRNLHRLDKQVSWEMGIAFNSPGNCFHGGAFFEGIGDRFDQLHKRNEIINADVLDAWFPPAPAVEQKVNEHLSWAMRTSPPTTSGGLEEIIAEVRGVHPENILAGGGSSDLIFLALQHWLSRDSNVLILDPTYGEYAHVLEKVVCCNVERYHLDHAENYRLNPERLCRKLEGNFDLFIWVNPNSPTGQFISRNDVISVIEKTNPNTRFWIDETYIEYVGKEHSIETYAAASRKVVVCKSMSKVYALSGMRAAYLCASAHQLEDLRVKTPPWSIGLPSQIAAVAALQSDEYYEEKYRETHLLREALTGELRSLGISDIIQGVANFILFHLPVDGITSSDLIEKCRKEGLYLRNASGMGTGLGDHAVRLAVKDAESNKRTIEILGECLK